MRDAYVFHRYRKWKRKALHTRDPLALMKWRYWYKLNGEHMCLWDQEIDLD